MSKNMVHNYCAPRRRRRIRAYAGLASIYSVTVIPAAASQWDLAAPNVTTTESPPGEGALRRTWIAQRAVEQTALPVGPMATTAMNSDLREIQARVTASRSISLPLNRPATARRRSTSGGPDIFGSVAVAIGSTPYDGRWRQASTSNSGALGNWTGSFASLQNSEPEQLLREVNAWVNQRIDFVEDMAAGVPGDTWQSALQSLRSGRGDCEDYALAKHGLLAALGFDRDDLYLLLVRDLVSRRNHAVLAVRLGERFVILDSATDGLLEGDLANDYQPIFSYSAAGRWIHGYPLTPQPPVRIAASTIPISTSEVTEFPRGADNLYGRRSR